MPAIGVHKKRQLGLALLRLSFALTYLETINAPLARRGIYLESLQLRLSGLSRLKYIGERILLGQGLKSIKRSQRFQMNQAVII